MNVKQVFMNNLKSHQLNRYSYDKESLQAVKTLTFYNKYLCAYQLLRAFAIAEGDSPSNETVSAPIQRVGLALFNRD